MSGRAGCDDESSLRCWRSPPGQGVFPPLPGESILVTPTSLEVAGHLNLVLGCPATTAGAVVGDVAAYGIGRSISSRTQSRARSVPRGDAALRWVSEHEGSWGPGVIVLRGFLPGRDRRRSVGRAAGQSAGAVPWLRRSGSGPVDRLRLGTDVPGSGRLRAAPGPARSWRSASRWALARWSPPSARSGHRSGSFHVGTSSAESNWRATTTSVDEWARIDSTTTRAIRW